MEKYYCILIAGILCLMIIASGCTSPSPAVTATPPVTTAAPSIPSWTGTWNTTWLGGDGNQTVSVATMTQAGSDVTGNYSFTYPGEGNFAGYFNATVAGNTLSGTYYDSDGDVGYLIFTLSADGNSFTGRWVHAGNKSELDTTPTFWNGVRITH